MLGSCQQIVWGPAYPSDESLRLLGALQRQTEAWEAAEFSKNTRLPWCLWLGKGKAEHCPFEWTLEGASGHLQGQVKEPMAQDIVILPTCLFSIPPQRYSSLYLIWAFAFGLTFNLQKVPLSFVIPVFSVVYKQQNKWFVSHSVGLRSRKLNLTECVFTRLKGNVFDSFSNHSVII